MKYVFPFLIVLAFALPAYTQSNSLTDAQWQPLFEALDGEDWDTAERLASKYLDEVKPGTDDRTLPRLRYMYLYSAAGKVAAKKMSYGDLEKRIKGFAGNDIFLPARRLVQSCKIPQDFNGLCRSNGQYDFMVTSGNRAATTIHAFEYIKLDEKIDWSKHDGDVAAILGKIDSIALNPNRSLILIMRIFVVNGRVIFRDQPKEK